MDYNYTVAATDSNPIAGLFSICCSLFVCLLLIAFFAFQIWMLVDAAQKKYPKENENEKLIWILLILFVPFTSILYYFIQRPKYKEIQTGSGEILSKPQESDTTK